MSASKINWAVSKNRSIDVPNLEIGYYQNKILDSTIYISTILDSHFGHK